MSGIYIHVPFCKQRCYYCDFFTSTQINQKPELVLALIQEIELRKDWLAGEKVKTIYFGGGTPSLLSVDEINSILTVIFQYFEVIQNPEITLEANPDDLSLKYITELNSTRVNRLSIGIQSFIDADLVMMNRRHTAQQAIDSVINAQNCGFNNISTDLIYGLPGSNEKNWLLNLEKMVSLKIQHLSAYHLTYEKGTVFDDRRKKQKLFPVSEEESISQFNRLMDWAAQHGFEHYEISNFATEGFYSKHNTNYWKQEKYLGIGPAAHSYNIHSRAWNPSNISQYINAIKKLRPEFETETLTLIDKHNEFLITSLRTQWGIDLIAFENQFGKEWKERLMQQAKTYIENQKLNRKNQSLLLTKEGIFVCDAILTELIIESE